MFSKSLLVLALFGFVASASAVTSTLVLDNDLIDSSTWSKDFNPTAENNIYNIVFPSGVSNLDASVSATRFASVGYDVTSVTFDGVMFVANVNLKSASRSQDYWSFALENITSGPHTLVVNGIRYGNGQAYGSIVISNTPLGVLSPVSPVPEPASIAMMLAGLAMVGGLQLRRKNTASRLAG